jgi:hypothetical protein
MPVRARTDSQDEVLKFEHVIVTIRAVKNRNRPIAEIDLLDFAVDEMNMSQDLAHRIDDVSKIQVARRHLMQHRGEQEKIILADHGDFKIGIATFLEFKGRVNPAKSATKNQYARLFHVSIR